MKAADRNRLAGQLRPPDPTLSIPISFLALPGRLSAEHGIFTEIDANQDGVLEVSEVMGKFRERGYRDEEIDEFLRMCDLDRSGTVSLDEFLAAFSQFVARARLSGRAGASP